MTEKTKPFTAFKLNKNENLLNTIKSISLIKIKNQNNLKDKKFLGIKRKLFKKVNN